MELIYAKPQVQPTNLTASMVKHGVPFRITYCPKTEVFMRVKPVNYILNSTLINDCINRNKVFVINLNKGTLFIIEGSREIILLSAGLVVNGDL